jgi:hypothetical protein
MARASSARADLRWAERLERRDVLGAVQFVRALVQLQVRVNRLPRQNLLRLDGSRRRLRPGAEVQLHRVVAHLLPRQLHGVRKVSASAGRPTASLPVLQPGKGTAVQRIGTGRRCRWHTAELTAAHGRVCSTRCRGLPPLSVPYHISTGTAVLQRTHALWRKWCRQAQSSYADQAAELDVLRLELRHALRVPGTPTHPRKPEAPDAKRVSLPRELGEPEPRLPEGAVRSLWLGATWLRCR